MRHSALYLSLVALGLVLTSSGCNYIPGDHGDALFERVRSTATNIYFSNELAYNNSFNIYTYRNFYAGGGVALGDVNDDGLLDLYLTANQKDNKLYLNRGNFEFEDVTEEAGVGGKKPWTTGVSMADVDGDGLLDIYVVNSGPVISGRRANELFVNNGDGTFTERAKDFGLADTGNSIHAAFFDYDNDGDLDLYVLNNYASKPIKEYKKRDRKRLRNERDRRGGDRLYRNDGGTFVEVTEAAGIYNGEIGFGLGVSVGDVNRDGWMDIYVSNDFFERDYLYINTGGGKFEEVLEDKFSSISTTSMGGDVADLNNDLMPEIFVTDMLPRAEERLKTVADFIEWEQYQSEIEMGYHRKFARNTLQYNNGDGTFSEIGRYAEVEATGWSWGGLAADFNLSGHRELFVPNGFYKDVTDKDHMMRVSTNEVMRSVVENGQVNYSKLVEMTPSVPLSNYMFENQGNLKFSNRASEWGLGEKVFSNGSAYGDLDRDGDLDLVVNNVKETAFVYRNRASELYPERDWLQIGLEGDSLNTFGVGAQVEVSAGEQHWYAEQMPQRGFQSSMDPTLHFGLGKGVSTIDTLEVRWPDGRTSRRTDVDTNQRLTVRQAEAGRKVEHSFSEQSTDSSRTGRALLEEVTEDIGLRWSHEESAHNDFEHSPLLFHMRSTEGPPLCAGDVNGSGREDTYVGGARGQAGALFVQRGDGQFDQVQQPALAADREAEDTACVLFDATGDGTSELYVASGSSEFFAGSSHLADRIYRINGRDRLARMDAALSQPEPGPMPTGTVRAADVDGDGDQDLFVGTRMMPADEENSQGYGVPVGARLLENTGTGTFEDATDRWAPGLRAQELKAAGITDAAWGDIDGNGTPDLLMAGEWMPLTVFFNRNGTLERADLSSVGLEDTRGWWQSLTLTDLDGDGTLDVVAGNHGLNSRFRARPDQPVRLWAGDMAQNDRIEHVLASYNQGGGPYPVIPRQNLIKYFPHLKEKYPTFEDYAGETVTEVFGEKRLSEAEQYRAEQMASVVGWNDGEGHFRVDSLPFRAQLAPMYGILASDLDGQKGDEILMGGNLTAVKPQAGPYDASYGTVFRQDSTGYYREVTSRGGEFSVSGEIRSIRILEQDDRNLVLIARNDQSLKVYEVSAL